MILTLNNVGVPIEFVQIRVISWVMRILKTFDRVEKEKNGEKFQDMLNFPFFYSFEIFKY